MKYSLILAAMVTLLFGQAAFAHNDNAKRHAHHVKGGFADFHHYQIRRPPPCHIHKHRHKKRVHYKRRHGHHGHGYHGRPRFVFYKHKHCHVHPRYKHKKQHRGGRHGHH